MRKYLKITKRKLLNRICNRDQYRGFIDEQIFIYSKKSKKPKLHF